MTFHIRITLFKFFKLNAKNNFIFNPFLAGLVLLFVVRWFKKNNLKIKIFTEK